MICFEHAAPSDEAVEVTVGDALRWVGPGVWRVEKVDGDHVTVRLWPDDEPYPGSIKEVGPGEWPTNESS